MDSLIRLSQRIDCEFHDFQVELEKIEGQRQACLNVEVGNIVSHVIKLACPLLHGY
jgi:hypothetical protein